MLEITEIKTPPVITLELKGRMDAITSDQLDGTISTLLAQRETQFVIDFSQLEYISSSGLRVLLMAAKKLKNADGQLILCSLNDHIKTIFDISGFSSVFSIVQSRKEALNRHES